MGIDFSLTELFADLHTLRIVEIGASPVDGEPPYQQLVRRGAARVVGFEPDAEACRRLQAQGSEAAAYLPYAIGDGREATLHVCQSPGMSSLYEPDMEILGAFRVSANGGASSSVRP